MNQVEDNKALPGFLRSQRLVDVRTTDCIHSTPLADYLSLQLAVALYVRAPRANGMAHSGKGQPPLTKKYNITSITLGGILWAACLVRPLRFPHLHDYHSLQTSSASC